MQYARHTNMVSSHKGRIVMCTSQDMLSMDSALIKIKLTMIFFFRTSLKRIYVCIRKHHWFTVSRLTYLRHWFGLSPVWFQANIWTNPDFLLSRLGLRLFPSGDIKKTGGFATHISVTREIIAVFNDVYMLSNVSFLVRHFLI